MNPVAPRVTPSHLHAGRRSGAGVGRGFRGEQDEPGHLPALDLPVIYVAQPYGGMDPAQMEGLLTNYYEYHFLYITGIHHVEIARTSRAWP